MAGRIIAVWIMIRQHMVCVICVYGPQPDRTDAEKEAFREEVGRSERWSDDAVRCGRFQCAHRCGQARGRRKHRKIWMGNNEKGRAGTGGDVEEERLAVAGTFFQKKESQTITYMSRRHKTELDLLVVRQQQLRRVKDCKALAGEYVTTQHKPVVLEVRMKKWKEKRTMGPKNIRRWKCKDEIMVEYMERVRRKYEELDAEKGTVEGEWRQYKDAFVGGGGGSVW